MFWHMNDDASIPSERKHLFQLQEQVRSTDTWLNYVLACDPVGTETWEI